MAQSILAIVAALAWPSALVAAALILRARQQ